MEDMDKLDEELKGAMRKIVPPKDFAVRTARKAGETEIHQEGVRPVVWGTLAAAACLLFAVIASQSVKGRRPSEAVPIQEAVALAPAQLCPAGPAFVAKGGKIASYGGITPVKVVWNFSQNAPELIVEAFPWED